MAHPVYLTGYIDRLGTGTNDLIDACVAKGLKTPEFIQDDDFRVIIWRSEGNRVEAEKVTESGQKETEFAEKSNRVQGHLTKKQQLVLESCTDIPRSGQEILEFVGVKYQTKTLNQYVNKMVECGKLRPTKLKENDPNRKYITSNQ